MLGFISYFIVGAIWTVTKWYFFLLKEKDKCLEKNKDRDNWHQWATIDPPKVSDHKSNIMLWMSYWPISAIWTIINDPIKKLFTLIFNKIKNGMQAMSDNIFAPLVKEHELKIAAQEERETKLHNERTGISK